jgi:hypothetical protein
MGYPSEIRPPFGWAYVRRLVPLGGSTHWGRLIKYFLIRSSIGPLAGLPDQRGLYGHPIGRVSMGECEVQPWTWIRENDLWASILAHGSLGACSVHPSLCVGISECIPVSHMAGSRQLLLWRDSNGVPS